MRTHGITNTVSCVGLAVEEDKDPSPKVLDCQGVYLFIFVNSFKINNEWQCRQKYGSIELPT